MKDSPLLKKVYNYRDSYIVKEWGVYPYFRPISSAQGTEVVINGKTLIMLGSNSYLGLTNHPYVKKKVIEAVEKYGSGCAGSRFLNGTLDIHLKLEERLSSLVNKEATILFSTGFQANLGAISALIGKDEYVIIDKQDHASIVDGCRLCSGEILRFKHNDMNSLENKLKNLPIDKGKLIVVDGIFSMEGDIINLPEVVKYAKKYKAEVMVDDAHAIGVLGKNGAGTCSHFGITSDVHIIMGTFSKSLASLGGFISSDKQTIEYLKHKARSLIFSASISPANTAAVLAALDIMEREPERIHKLWENTTRMRKGLQQLGFDTGRSTTPVIPVYVGDMRTCFKMCRLLHERGVFVNPVVPPAVSEGRALIRISLMATHTFEQIDRALDIIHITGKELNIIK